MIGTSKLITQAKVGYKYGYKRKFPLLQKEGKSELTEFQHYNSFAFSDPQRKTLFRLLSLEGYGGSRVKLTKYEDNENTKRVI